MARPRRRFSGKGKSIFFSLTFWAIICLCIEATTPKIEAMIEKQYIDAKDVIGIINNLALTAGGIIFRIQAKEPIYTPRGIPGPNASDFAVTPRRRRHSSSEDNEEILDISLDGDGERSIIQREDDSLNH